ncbi:MAG: N-acetylmuramoyl-L-alanine amidase [Clostridia bacterium]|nr:N-acetylmuramoyl-L-alanine amidase [Clostridia bacterium]
MKMKIKSKRRFFLSLSILIIIAMAFNGKNLLNKVLTSDAIGNKSSNSTKENKFQGTPISISKEGTITFDQSEYFKKYIIKLVDKKQYSGYKEDDDYIYLDLKAVDKHKLNSNSFKEDDEKIFLSKIDGKTTMTIKKEFTQNNFVFLNELTNYLMVLISKKEEPFTHTVVVDPGHGGGDPGTEAYDKSFFEKEVTLKIALEMRPELIFYGKKVVMTRDKDLESDEYLERQRIVDIANENQGDAFVSVHIDAYDKSNIYNGISVYYAQSNSVPEESEAMALKIQEKILTSDNWNDRGIKFEDFKVIRLAQMPAVLVECGFASNPEDVKRLNDNNVLNNLAKNISAGIIAYLDGK